MKNKNDYKWSVGYNIFDDSLSTLKGSVKSIRGSVDHISIIYQDISNIGQPATKDIRGFLEQLKSENLIDEIVKYSPILNRGVHYNEVCKRTLGMICSEDNNCNFSISMDSDEYYIKEQLENIKQKYIDDNLDVVYAPLVTYYKDFEHMFLDDYYVPLFYRMTKNKYYTLGLPSAVLVDPTRRSEYTNYFVADRDIIEMHHASYIRNSSEIVKKYNNSSARVNFDQQIDGLIHFYNEWKDGEQAMIAGSPCRMINLIKCENKFKDL